MSDISPDRSSFKTTDVGYALQSKDPWFRPVDIQVGPDGGIYVADFYEQRIDHASHYQGRVHKESGRIYRLSSRRIGVPPVPPTRSESKGNRFDLTQESPQQLAERLFHPNKWIRQAARRELIIRGDDLSNTFPIALDDGQGSLRPNIGQHLLESYWAKNAARAHTDDEQFDSLNHAHPQIRLWAIRLACDDNTVTNDLAAKLADLAYREPNVEVRSQLAASARRLPAAQALPIIKNLAQRSEDTDDIHIPLLLWWAIESKADKDRDAVLALFTDKAFWDQPLVSKHLTERLMRRYAASGQRKDLLTAAKLLELAPTKEHATQLMAGLEAAYAGRTVANLPVELATAMAKAGATSPTIRLRQGDSAAVEESLAAIADEKGDAAKRQQLVAIFGTIQQPRCVPPLLQLVATSRNDGLRSAALAALQAYNDPAIGPAVLSAYPELPEQVRDVAQSLLVTRPAWATALLEKIDARQIDPQTISEPTIRRLQLYETPRIVELCEKHFGKLAGQSPDELRAQIERYSQVISSGKGNPYAGKLSYKQMCGKCHTLFGQGGQIGPDLTTYKRDDLRGMLLNVLQPSAEIREGFENFVARTADGRLLAGLLADQDTHVVVIRSADGQNISVPREELEDLRASPLSLMPAGQLQDLSDQQIRDLFAYLRSTQPLADRN